MTIVALATVPKAIRPGNGTNQWIDLPSIASSAAKSDNSDDTPSS
jgi:hypothetical protein